MSRVDDVDVEAKKINPILRCCAGGWDKVRLEFIDPNTGGTSQFGLVGETFHNISK